MKRHLLYFLFLFSFIVSAQQKITFQYDEAGNQTLRELCLSGCTVSSKPAKEIEKLTNDDLLQFSPQDVISYYPNPVKEDLYLQWQLLNENFVTAVYVYSITGQVLRVFQTNESINSLNISFQSYPAGVYIVLLSYKDGGEKSIKIIKK